MDIQMPVMDGYTATEKIRAFENKELASIPIIAMTANAFEEDRQKALNVGMNAHIAKPIEVETVLATIEQVLKC
jgi:CheY-like chemotaxis protein